MLDIQIHSRNPTVQIREVPSRRAAGGRLVGEEVAIPPYRSGKFQGATMRSDLNYSRQESQSHRTDQGSSKALPERIREAIMVEVAIPPYRSGKFQVHRRRSGDQLDACVAIPPYRSGKFQDNVLPTGDRHRYRRNPTVQIREVPSSGIPRSGSARITRSRNPTVQIREVPRNFNPRFEQVDISVAIPPYRSGKFQGRPFQPSESTGT